MNFHRKFLFGILTVTAFGFSAAASRADDTSPYIDNPGFETGEAGYYLAVAGDSKDMKCRFAMDTTTFHSGKQSALLQADDFARFGIGPKVPCHPLSGGERYRVGVWVKPGADFKAMPGTPGVVLRMNPASGFPPTAAASMIFINLDKTVSTGISRPRP